MMTAFASLVLAVLTGFGVSWTTVPSGPGRSGSALVTVVIDREDLVSVYTSGAGVARYELTVGIGGEFARAGGRVDENGFPVVEELLFENLSTGSHRVEAALLDLETGERVVQRVEVVIDSASTETWSSAGLRLSPSGTVRASGNLTILWDVYPPVGSMLSGAAYAVLDQNLNVMREGWMELSREGEGVVGYSVTLPLGGLERGLYRVNTAVMDDGSSVMATSSSSIRLLSSWDLWGDDPRETLTLIRPVATARELSDLQNATGPGQRQAVMSEFWLRRDPNPATRENEYLNVYRQRLDYIERTFTRGSTRGIITDMGTVFAKLGEPDMVEDHPFQTGGYPYQIWTYFSPSVTLVFVDRTGFGNYELDGDWRDVNRAFGQREAWHVY
jgi:GWxTD domain-containing protein